MDDSIDLAYSEPAKWERHRRGHSPGRLNLSHEELWFEPDRASILEKGFSVSLSTIASISRSDNWLFRGAVDIRLTYILRIEISFQIDPEKLVPGMEQAVFESNELRLFLGSSRKIFMESIHRMGVPTDWKTV